MRQPDNHAVPAAPYAGSGNQDFYLPLGGGVDPDLFVPEDRLHPTGRFSRWIQSLPVFGSRTPRQ